jgi:DNA-binding response OmpR family regulator
VALVDAILRPAGHDVAVASDLSTARDWLRASVPALVLLDRHLPDGDGLDLAREI